MRRDNVKHFSKLNRDCPGHLHKSRSFKSLFKQGENKNSFLTFSRKVGHRLTNGALFMADSFMKRIKLVTGWAMRRIPTSPGRSKSKSLTLDGSNDTDESKNLCISKSDGADLIGESYTTDLIGESYTADLIGEACTSELIGESCTAELIGMSCTAGLIGESYTADLIADSCTAETNGETVTAKTIGESGMVDTKGDSCTAETNGESSTAGTIGESSTAGTIGESCTALTIRESCTAGTIVESCTAGTNGESCIADIIREFSAALLIAESSTADIIKNSSTADLVGMPCTAELVETSYTAGLVSKSFSMDQNINAKTLRVSGKSNNRGGKSCKKVQSIVAQTTCRKPAMPNVAQSVSGKCLRHLQNTKLNKSKSSHQNTNIVHDRSPIKERADLGTSMSVVGLLQFEKTTDTIASNELTSEAKGLSTSEECRSCGAECGMLAETAGDNVKLPWKKERQYRHLTETFVTSISSQDLGVDGSAAKQTISRRNTRFLGRKCKFTNASELNAGSYSFVQSMCRRNADSNGVKQRSFRKKVNISSRKSELSGAGSSVNAGYTQFSLKSHFADMGDWPSLVDIERPKGLIMEAAKEIVRNKQVGSVSKNARKMFADIATEKANGVDSVRHAVLNIANQISDCMASTANQISDCMASTANQKTWASVAAKSLFDQSKTTVGHEHINSVVSSSVPRTEDIEKRTSDNSNEMFKSTIVSDTREDSQQFQSDTCQDKQNSLLKHGLVDSEKRMIIRQHWKAQRCRRKVRLDDVVNRLTEQASSLRNHKHNKLTIFEVFSNAHKREILSKESRYLAGNKTDKNVSPAAESVVSQKKISVKYRALLRSDKGRQKQRSVSETFAKNKRTNPVVQIKITTRTKQLYKQLERQRARLPYQKSPTIVSRTQDTNHSACNTCPYWLRSRGLNGENLEQNISINNQIVGEDTDTDTETKDVFVINKSCRRSERLREKYEKKLSTVSPQQKTQKLSTVFPHQRTSANTSLS